MLTRLTITNYALISELTIRFHPGLNTVTGETGAGKSIILGALGLILGNRADMTALYHKEQKCIVEGTFDIRNYSLTGFFEENDLDYDPVTILRREITPSGKSRAFINDTPVNLKTLQEMALFLIDIHSQHQNLELGQQNFQLSLIDTVSGSGEGLNIYREQYQKHVSLQKQLDECIRKSEKASADLDYFQFQFNQLNEARLRDGEQEELEAELERLTHAEEIKSALLQAANLLDNEHNPVLHNIRESRKTIASVQDFIGEGTGLADRLQGVYLELNDIIGELEPLAESIEYDPERIEQVNDRLNLIYTLQQKHHVADVAGLVSLQQYFEQQISQAEGYDEEIKMLRKNLEQSAQQLESKAVALTEIRRKSFAKVEESVVGDLRQLGMAKSKFRIDHKLLSQCGPDGKDAISFLFNANGEDRLAEIQRIASGGELSRLMLAVKNLLRMSKSLPTVIFDEIDSGISGEVAVKMGNILKSFAKTTQIINITHLPQIAARGDAHFLVYKEEKDGKPLTSVRQLSDAERVEELAKMVGGENTTESTLKTAQELLNG